MYAKTPKHLTETMKSLVSIRRDLSDLEILLKMFGEDWQAMSSSKQAMARNMTQLNQIASRIYHGARWAQNNSETEF